MHMNVLLAREVRGAQDTIRELVEMGSRILALAVGALVDLTSQSSDSLGPSVCGATGAFLHAQGEGSHASRRWHSVLRHDDPGGERARGHRRARVRHGTGVGTCFVAAAAEDTRVGDTDWWATRTALWEQASPAVRMRSYTAVIECGCVFPVTCSMFRVCVRVSRLRVSPDASASRDRTRVAA